MRTKLAELFSIDLRSLALFRIAFGALLIVDLVCRAQFLELNYTDAGVLPRELLPSEILDGLTRYSLHKLSGGLALQVALFCGAGLFALMLMVGAFTRIATIASWLLLISLHYRNPMVLDGGDVLLRQLLLWSIFLPLGERWSVDAKRRGEPPRRTAVTSFASAALLLQFVFFYVSTGLAKSGPEWHVEGTALEMALAQTYWSRPLGQALCEYPDLLNFMTTLVVHFESWGPLLIFVPLWTAGFRILVFLGFFGLMAGLAFTIQLNLFPFDGILVSLPLLPAAVWEWRRRAPDDGVERVPRYRLQASEWLAGIVVVPLLGYAVWLNLLAHHQLGNPRLAWVAEHMEATLPVLHVSDRLGIDQNWTMYGPSPPGYDLEFTVVADFADGTRRPLIVTPGGEHWPPAAAPHADYRFKFYFERMIRPSEGTPPEPRIEAYLEWICRGWNADPGSGGRLTGLTLLFLPSNIDPNPKIAFPPAPLQLAGIRCP